MYTPLQIIIALVIGIAIGSYTTWLIVSARFKEQFEEMEQEQKQREIFS